MTLPLTGVPLTEHRDLLSEMAEYESFTVRGMRLGEPPPGPVPVMVAALRPGMLRLAGREADGAIVNWLAAEDVPTVAPYVREHDPAKEIVARIFVCPTTDADRARAIGRRMITAYLNVPVYAAFHDWLGRGEVLAKMWDAWRAGDREAGVTTPVVMLIEPEDTATAVRDLAFH